MDFLEHVEEPQKILAQASRLVRDGGPVIFHTFNRTIAARFLAIKAVEWIARDCPQHFHVYDLFIPPTSLYQWAATEGLQVQGLTGIRPKILSRGFWLSILQRRVHPRLEFQLTGSLTLGYLGYATKQGPSRSATLVSHKTIQSVSKILH
jgi:2-polyprenyl-6-hydroxyphenyl methylase/3-demethylubiquinone-9 3-methyltransferase